VNFTKEQESKEKVFEANSKLHKEMKKAAFAAKHGDAKDSKEGPGSSKVPTGQAALFLALEEQINDNLLDMSFHSQTLGNLAPEMQRQSGIYDKLSAQQDNLATEDPDQLNADSSELKAELMVATTTTDALSTKASTESHYMSEDAKANAGLTGIGSFLVRTIIDKQGQYSRA
jgi:hypothetical protein